jgi:hypothetical protein
MPLFWQWITPSGSTTAATAVVTAYTSSTSTWLGDDCQTMAATIPTWSIYNQQQAAGVWCQDQAALQNASAQLIGLQAQQAAYAHHYAFASCQPTALIDRIYRPAVITHQEQARRDEELYRRALAECNEQEAARILRLIEQRELTEQARRLALQAQQQRAAEEQERRCEADSRATQFLLAHLTPAQRDTLTKNGWFVVLGGRSKTKYRIRSGTLVANVDVLDRNDRQLHRLCAHARSGSVPMGDQLLGQKIMLELAEDDFLRVANRH